MWKLAFSWAKRSHPNKSKRWVIDRHFGAFRKSRNDRWVFGDRGSGAYLAKFAWTPIVRHQVVKGSASPDDPALAEYWAARRRRRKPPLDNARLRLIQAQHGRCLGCLLLSGLRILIGSHQKGRNHMTEKYRKFSPEFREEAARMVVETSRAVADVARELGISETSLGNWVRTYREKHAEDEPPLQLSERARLRELERENRELRMKSDFLSKAAAYVCPER